MFSSNVSSKDQLASSFGKAAHEYDASAQLQQSVGSRLLNALAPVVGEGVTKSLALGRAMDLGCGTGYFSSKLVTRLNAKKLILADISAPMLSFAHDRVLNDLEERGVTERDVLVESVQLDAELLPFTDSCLTLVYSSLALQWVGDLSSSLARIYDALEPGGVLGFSTLVDGTLYELKEAWATVDGQKHVNDFLPFDQCLEFVKRSGFTVELSEERCEVIKYSKPIGLMKDLKAIGAHNISQGRSKSLTGKSKLSKVLSAYECYRDNDGTVPATYRVAYFILRKEKAKDA